MHVGDKSGWSLLWPILIPLIIIDIAIGYVDKQLGIDLQQVAYWKRLIHYSLLFFFGFGAAYLREYWRENHWF